MEITKTLSVSSVDIYLISREVEHAVIAYGSLTILLITLTILLIILIYILLLLESNKCINSME